MRGTARVVLTALAVLVAFLLQVTLLPRMGWPEAGGGAVPGLVLLVVVATSLATDTRFGTLTGFCAGLLMDLAPPADHVAGRWALALLAVGYVVGRLSHDHQSDLGVEGRPGLPLVLGAAAGGSFVGNSVFALTGLLLRDPALGVGDLLEVVGVGLLMDVVAGVVVVPLLLWLHRRDTAVDDRLTPGLARRTAP